jgi:hypothetical protein
MPAFFTAAHVRLSLLLSVLGALVALVFTILSDSGAVALVFRPLVSGLLMFLLGSGLYALLAKKVPEAIDVIENKSDEDSLIMPDDTDAMPEGDTGGSELASEGEDFTGTGEGMQNYDSSDSSMGGGSNIPRKTGVQIGKEEIVVNGVKFKNQPEVMAETIKQLMDQDKE